MTFSKRRLFTALAMIAAVSMTASIVSGQKKSDNQASASSNASEMTIEGAWRTVVTNCTSSDDAQPDACRQPTHSRDTSIPVRPSLVFSIVPFD